MRDLDVAKQTLVRENLSLVIVKNGKIIFKSNLHGIIGLLQAIDNLGKQLNSASIADKIVGKAAALLMVYSHVSSVYATLMSNDGLMVLRKNNVEVEYDGLTPRIMNRRGDDICPFEKISLTTRSPEEAYVKLKNYAKKTYMRRLSTAHK